MLPIGSHNTTGEGRTQIRTTIIERGASPHRHTGIRSQPGGQQSDMPARRWSTNVKGMRLSFSVRSYSMRHALTIPRFRQTKPFHPSYVVCRGAQDVGLPSQHLSRPVAGACPEPPVGPSGLFLWSVGLPTGCNNPGCRRRHSVTFVLQYRMRSGCPPEAARPGCVRLFRIQRYRSGDQNLGRKMRG